MSLIVDGITIPMTFEVSPDFLTAEPVPQVDITRLEQESDAWCYAACAAMVIRHSISGESVDQCKVAEFVKKPAKCCPVSSADPDCTDSGCGKDQIAPIFTEWKVSSVEVGFSLPFVQVMTEINENRPIEVVIDWDSDTDQVSSHAVLVVGFIEDVDEELEMIYVIDPLQTLDYEGWHTYGHVDAGFGFGMWAMTWFDLRTDAPFDLTKRA
jgi:hypothetical protein